MEGKPIHFDGSKQANEFLSDDYILSDPFTLTDGIRQSICANPFDFNVDY